MLIAAVARILSPGCKADHIPILEGEQGTLKSSLLDALFCPWFSDDLAELGSKDAQMQAAAGVWCIEIAELTSMRRADIEKVKGSSITPRGPLSSKLWPKRYHSSAAVRDDRDDQQ